jgi:hypothetical protein
MSWRAILEDAYTVKCKACGVAFVDPGRWPSQKWLRGRCPLCGHVHRTEGLARGEFQARCMYPESNSSESNGGDKNVSLVRDQRHSPGPKMP